MEACRDRLRDFGDRCHPRRVRHDKDNPEASASGTGGSIRVVNPELVEFKAQVGILQSGKPKLEKIEVQLKDLSARTAHAGVVQRRDANCLPCSRSRRSMVQLLAAHRGKHNDAYVGASVMLIPQKHTSFIAARVGAACLAHDWRRGCGCASGLGFSWS